eukprot:TRINITY_DN19808_c0_g1_i1.p1 TRINITY_DN19808_c0_g1~~TRINITY_DN19808_c0_g1_i1.p1  ORF type:complete len:318 (+),score=61.12 TRINITY_DN19808_c0_g1_i1:269-1222(+)
MRSSSFWAATSLSLSLSRMTSSSCFIWSASASDLSRSRLSVDFDATDSFTKVSIKESIFAITSALFFNGPFASAFCFVMSLGIRLSGISFDLFLPLLLLLFIQMEKSKFFSLRKRNHSTEELLKQLEKSPDRSSKSGKNKSKDIPDKRIPSDITKQNAEAKGPLKKSADVIANMDSLIETFVKESVASKSTDSRDRERSLALALQMKQLLEVIRDKDKESEVAAQKLEDRIQESTKREQLLEEQLKKALTIIKRDREHISVLEAKAATSEKTIQTIRAKIEVDLDRRRKRLTSNGSFNEDSRDPGESGLSPKFSFEI